MTHLESDEKRAPISHRNQHQESRATFRLFFVFALRLAFEMEISFATGAIIVVKIYELPLAPSSMCIG